MLPVAELERLPQSALPSTHQWGTFATRGELSLVGLVAVVSATLLLRLGCVSFRPGLMLSLALEDVASVPADVPGKIMLMFWISFLMCVAYFLHLTLAEGSIPARRRFVRLRLGLLDGSA